MNSRVNINLKASQEGERKIQQARRNKGWIIDDRRWLVGASKVLEPDRNWENSSDNLYIERPPLEDNCYQEIVKPGSLLRIKAPKYMGKTRLLSHIMQKLEREKPDYFPLKFDFQLADSTVYS